MDTITLALTGDVMLGRGVDQILPHPSEPTLHEPHVRSALTYVALAERANGPIPRPVGFAYVWGDALETMRQADARIVNLETSVTTSEAFEPKGINYRMHPDNVGCLRAAGIECCVLANNHVLDWGVAGLLETLETLERAGVHTAGAGRDLAQAAAPAAIALAPAGSGRLLVFAYGSPTSGIPPDWAAGPGRPGVHLLRDLSDATVARIAEAVRAARRPGDIAIASIHWGPNWGYDIPPAFRRFAHALLDQAGFALVHGHSSHHAQGLEIHRNRLILYGAGDFLNDYEGIGGYEEFRGDLAVLYLPRLSRATGELLGLTLAPFRIGRMRLNRPAADDVRWLAERLDRESRRFGVRVRAEGGHGHLLVARPGEG
ncbi:CapA family protein [Caldovatus aquaticus]|uniref:CapA family protein n=1 Tax=Caldovatus aquaticus TaxID=2865671 RepID=A0ABS7EX57_9PROT|nr:CapA family protein [Caldovatus aquaticus]MBW8267942.1 CapA family protein [Caldovatus aquaticus]